MKYFVWCFDGWVWRKNRFAFLFLCTIKKYKTVDVKITLQKIKNFIDTVFAVLRFIIKFQCDWRYNETIDSINEYLLPNK